MLEALYLKTIERKEEINNFFENVTKEIDQEKVEKEYVDYDFTKNKQDMNFSAIDGSYNKTKYMAGYIYAITSQTIVSKAGTNLFKESTAAEISTLSTIYNRRIERILSLQMNIFELKSTLNTLRKHEDIHYMLMDGSIRGSLMNYKSIDNIPKVLTSHFTKYYDIIEEALQKEDVDIEITTERIKGLISKECEEIIEKYDLDFEFKDRYMDIMMYLEGIEQLLCIYYILKDYKEKIICVSKTSGTKSLFNETIPDSAVIEYMCAKSGYTHPKELPPTRIVRVINNEKRYINFPVKNRQLRESTFMITFTKLENKSNVLKIEIPRQITEDELIRVLDNLESISINGYPHILKKAHDEVKIKSKYMERIRKNMGIYDKTGRDMLN